jgi:hypothetical protein
MKARLLATAAACGVAAALLVWRPWARDAREQLAYATGTVDVQANLQTFYSWGDPGLQGQLNLQVVITNNTGSDIYLVDEPSMPGKEATPSSLTLHYDVEDFPANADANLNIFPVPRQTLLPSGGSVTRNTYVVNPVRVSNWVRLYWDTSTTPPTYLRKPPSVTLVSPVTFKVVVGYGTAPFVYSTSTVPQDARKAFLAWQQRATSAVVTLTP